MTGPKANVNSPKLILRAAIFSYAAFILVISIIDRLYSVPSFFSTYFGTVVCFFVWKVCRR